MRGPFGDVETELHPDQIDAEEREASVRPTDGNAWAQHADGPAPQHGFVRFRGLVAGDYTVQRKSGTGIPLPETKITYPTAKTILGTTVVRKQGSAPGQGGAGDGSGASAGGVAPASLPQQAA